MVRKLLLVCLLFKVCVTSIMATDIEEIKEWTPQRLHEPHILKDISDLINNESCEPIINSPSESRKDYGFSIPGVHHLQKALLKKVKALYDESGQRPHFLDLAAGHGHMSWKAAVAGAYVVAVEKQPPTAQSMCRNMAKVKPFLAEGESVKTICTMHCGDVLDFTKPYYKPKALYDFVWAGHLYHFLTLTQARNLTSKLFESTRAGAYIAITVNAPAGHPSIVEKYKTQKEAGNPQPGYMVLDKYTYTECNRRTGEQRNIRTEIIGGHPLTESSDETEQYLPSHEFHGHYGQKTEEPQWEFHEQKGLLTICKRKAHSAFHFMGPDELRTLFESAGFVVEDVHYFVLETGESRPVIQMTEDLLKKGPQPLGILARKPLLSH